MTEKNPLVAKSYDGLLQGVVHLLEEARRSAARSVNAFMTATYWEIGCPIVEHEQHGKRRADYGEALLARLAADLTGQFGRGFSERNLGRMRLFYLSWKIPPTVSAKSAPVAGIKPEALEPDAASLRSPARFPLPWSHYVRGVADINGDVCATRDHLNRKKPSLKTWVAHTSIFMYATG